MSALRGKTKLFLESTARRASHGVWLLQVQPFVFNIEQLHHFCKRNNVESSRELIDPAAPLPAGRLEVGGRLVGPWARNRQNREAVSSGIIAPRLHLPDLKSRRAEQGPPTSSFQHQTVSKKQPAASTEQTGKYPLPIFLFPHIMMITLLELSYAYFHWQW